MSLKHMGIDGEQAGDVYEVDELPTCEWFALCTNEAEVAIQHPVLGFVPICPSCLERHKREVLESL
jgi:hypothetical protein